ncbi:conserved hypothetical protein [Isorropodon fossajaponicum endosymbiont JTNG4]|uniref:CDP-glycerol glycerophosphotransferase family protein n=1 Tax=Isorropodon fossajaponicum symbiont TaxID=883811 RepID=UPI001916B850|nr:CDP-glycerol glycerophosphotransferase family protein [Isorropodon fossajaponicum symbiont]BBB24138.1 conserved hypothetical protein [Isorropodon fossajaponicum endosymbiont JTNG4]
MIKNNKSYWEKLYKIILPIFWIVSLFPRDKNIWVYSEGFTNSSLPLLKYSKKQDKNTHIYITPFDIQVSKLRNEGIIAFKQSSILGCYYISRAQVHIICKSKLEDLNKYLSHKALVINLFHGLHRVTNNIVPPNHNQHKPQWRLNRNKAKFQKLYNRYLFLCATSEFTRQLYSQLFRVNHSTLPIVGIPRLDRLHSKQTDRKYIIKNISSSLKKFSTIFAYMPSGRRHKWNNNIDLKKMNEFLLHNNSALIIRSHRAEKSPIHLNKTHSNIYASSSYSQEWSDVVDELIGVDVLISDYSSLTHEFLITNRPVLVYLPDYQELIDAGGSAVNFDLDIPSDRINTFDNLLESMDSTIQQTYSYDKYNKLANKYHLYQDGDSSKRVYEHINKHLETFL